MRTVQIREFPPHHSLDIVVLAEGEMGDGDIPATTKKCVIPYYSCSMLRHGLLAYSCSMLRHGLPSYSCSMLRHGLPSYSCSMLV